ncbi:DUF1003 domain-containing protein (plasmid) [Rhizobium grahamii]|uniref:DUF1003 domain-containing protein n=1 Tax=Rhizobium grahamii TaxID=1120045 RepID=A0A5Q0CCM2_9HYPH|nr:MULTISPECIES: DUF1003 domain-containing protein [Rhizobium]QFY63598.1 DUF1003 domain-containing protein [Rhizobium grahamii]QRM51638.1 DUF1003 domain-containing protein [Rhizobium sp. BG6]
MTIPIDAITGVPLEAADACRIADLRPALADYLRAQYPTLKPDDCIDRNAIEDLRRQYVIDLLKDDKGELTSDETEVADSIVSQDTLAENTDSEYEDNEGVGGRVADVVARSGGSWTFIIGFASFLVGWMVLNATLGKTEAFDAYPYVLLNLILSSLAAFQAPVIMMSQRRQEAKDRLRATNDYKVNLKAELEIRNLHEKMDRLIERQWQRIEELQRHIGKLALENAGIEQVSASPRRSRADRSADTTTEVLPAVDRRS